MRAVLVLIAWLAAVNAGAQTGASLSGRITDETGGVLPGVTVELRGAGEPLVAVTDAEGRYSFEDVSPGTYLLSMRLINFADINKRDLVVGGEPVIDDEVMRLSLSADVVVIGRRTFTNLADVKNPAEDLVGIAASASQGAITSRQLEVRPFMRQGEVLETVPGVIITQHSGEGKANQYFLRGLNLDHGSDFAMTVAGAPVNMVTHAHSQGYADLNFLIPELVAGVQVLQGPVLRGPWRLRDRGCLEHQLRHSARPADRGSCRPGPTASAGCSSRRRQKPRTATSSVHSKHRPMMARGRCPTRIGSSMASFATRRAIT